ncbi:MAG: ATP-binding protein, partial [Pseudomonadota bacterium]
PGIRQHEIARILERGVRADQSTPGHGIGLAIVGDIVRAYGGDLSIENNKTDGVCVTLHLRRRK